MAVTSPGMLGHLPDHMTEEGEQMAIVQSADIHLGPSGGGAGRAKIGAGTSGAATMPKRLGPHFFFVLRT